MPSSSSASTSTLRSASVIWPSSWFVLALYKSIIVGFYRPRPRSRSGLTLAAAYITVWLCSRKAIYGSDRGRRQRPGCDVPGAGRSDSPSDSGAAIQRRRLGVRTRGAIRHEPAGGFKAPEGARARGSHRARPRRAAPALPSRTRPIEAGGGVDRHLPSILGRELQQAR